MRTNLTSLTAVDVYSQHYGVSRLHPGIRSMVGMGTTIFIILFPDSGLKWKRSKRAMTVRNVKPTDFSHLFEMVHLCMSFRLAMNRQF